MLKTLKDATPFGVTLAWGLWPRQGLTKVRAKKEAQESHLMFLGM
jgi:hypothetical protein